MQTLKCLIYNIVATSTDINYGPYGDILSDGGFRVWILLILLSKDNADHWFAPVCSSWSFMCVSQHHRQLDPWGDKTVSWVNDGNSQNIRVCFLSLLSWLIGHRWHIEQPLDSYFFKTPCWERLLGLVGSVKLVTYLGAFGADAAKALQLWSSEPHCLDPLRRSRPANMQKLTTLSKRGSITGNALMPLSQHYPDNFSECYVQTVILPKYISRH